MKTNSYLTSGIGFLVLLLHCALLHASPSDLLEKAIYTEETKGEIPAAIEIYRQILNEAGADRALAAQAQLRLGLCELKLGNRTQAVSEIEQLKQRFPDKDKLLAIIDEHMPSLLEEMLTQIEQNYIETVDRGELMETALRAIVGKLDASGLLRTNDMAFISARELVQMNEGVQQKMAGIGVALKADEATGEVIVTTLLPGSPALKAGLRAQDRIVQIDETSLPAGKELEIAVKLLRGPVGTPVTATVKRGGEMLQVRLVRDTVRLPSVKGDTHKPDGAPEFMLDAERRIGYIRLTQLGQASPSEMTAALKDLQSRGMKGLILDLRNNPGGLLAEAVTVSDLFLDKGRILTVKGRNEEKAYDATAGEDFLGFPIAVIVNRNSASAAEIVAAALQDNQRATVVGERSYGQALVKSIVPLNEGIGALKLPVAAYFRPNGHNVNRYPGSKESDDWGVTPDEGYEVRFTEAELKQYETARSERDVLGAALPQSTFQDRQLEKAIEFVRGQ